MEILKARVGNVGNVEKLARLRYISKIIQPRKSQPSVTNSFPMKVAAKVTESREKVAKSATQTVRPSKDTHLK